MLMLIMIGVLLTARNANLILLLMDYTKAIELNPIHTDAYCNRGSAYFCKGEFDLAIADYTKAIELDPDSGEVYCNRGSCVVNFARLE